MVLSAININREHLGPDSPNKCSKRNRALTDQSKLKQMANIFFNATSQNQAIIIWSLNSIKNKIGINETDLFMILKHSLEPYQSGCIKEYIENQYQAYYGFEPRPDDYRCLISHPRTVSLKPFYTAFNHLSSVELPQSAILKLSKPKLSLIQTLSLLKKPLSDHQQRKILISFLNHLSPESFSTLLTPQLEKSNTKDTLRDLYELYIHDIINDTQLERMTGNISRYQVVIERLIDEFECGEIPFEQFDHNWEYADTFFDKDSKNAEDRYSFADQDI